jgi:OmpA-OmpF porin, OOP family
MYRRVAITLSLLGGVACAGTPDVSAPMASSPVRPGANEQVVVDHTYLIVDSSTSLDSEFAREKALVQSFVGTMPDGTYQSGTVNFGGFDRQTSPLAPFDRSQVRATADDLERLQEGTPIDRVFAEVAQDLSGKQGRAAIVLFSDGRPTDPVGRDLPEETVLDAARKLAASYNGDVCFHAVKVGDEAEGTEFLQKLANLTSCGSVRTDQSIQNVASLQGFSREVFLGALPQVAAAPRDSDGDGVYDDVDQCPGTPSMAKVDARGCWTIPGLNFAFDSSKIEPQYYAELNDLARVLKSNPDLRVRLDGHTDSVGSEAYNESLSLRRANAVREYLVQQGIDAGRLSAKGFGESRPAYSNETAENRALNRRTEITAL